MCPAGQTGPSHRGLFWTGRSAGSQVVSGENVQVCLSFRLVPVLFGPVGSADTDLLVLKGGELLQLHPDPGGRGVFSWTRFEHRSSRVGQRGRLDVLL